MSQMNNKNKAIMKLFKAYLLEENIEEKSDLLDKKSLKKRSFNKKELSKRDYRLSLWSMGKRWFLIKSNFS